MIKVQKWNKRYKEKNLDWLNKTIVRTISTQDKVAHTILCELALRGITPYRFKGKENNIKKECGLADLQFDESGKPSQMALIGEADTYYARMLHYAISDQIRAFDSLTNESNNNVHFFRYLRGLDGITSQNILSNQDKGKNQEHKASNSNEKEAKALSERPIGNSQLDYLLGLSENLKRLETKNIAEGKGSFKAIGIIGSDAYDKLLILQALRNKFPGVPFFTTDLDARFLHSSEIKWTRNLIVVSPFGLQLNAEKQNSPLFRDNLQTSLYISTLLALTCGQGYWQCEKSVHEPPNGWTRHPRVFEVGNYEAINISHTSNNTVHLDTQSNQLSSIEKKPNPIFTIVIVLCIIYITILAFALAPEPLIFDTRLTILLAAFHAIFFFGLYHYYSPHITSGIILIAFLLIFFIPKQFHFSVWIISFFSLILLLGS